MKVLTVSVGSVFTFLMVPFEAQRPFLLVQSGVSFFFLLSHVLLMSLLTNHCLTHSRED